MENMTELKKITVTDLIKQKEQYQVKGNKKEDLYIERLGATVTILQPEKALCLEAVEMTRDKELEGKADIFTVYNTMVEPNLKDKDLQEAYGCVEPTDIVEKIFEAGEINSISQAAFDLAGYSSTVTRVKDLKN